MDVPAQNLKVLHLEADTHCLDGNYRILVDGKHFKYISIDGGVYSLDDMCFPRVLIPQLPLFPPGNWNVGHIAKSTETNHPVFECVEHESLPSIQHDWHPFRIDYLDLSIDKCLKSRVRVASSPHFAKPVIAKFADFLWEIDYYNRETETYSWLKDTDIAPTFLGHITEERRIIGFLLEKIEGRHAEPDDLLLCQNVLSKLHALDIVHNDVNKHNFLIADGRAWLVDFESAEPCSDKDLMEREMSSLAEELADMSGKGGVITVVQEARRAGTLDGEQGNSVDAEQKPMASDEKSMF